MFNSMMGSDPIPSLRGYFALATLVLAFLILFPLGRGLGGQLPIHLQGRLYRVVPDVLGPGGMDWGSVPHSNDTAALFR